MFQTPCVILCGGKSSRMGENKALLPFNNEKTLIEFQYKKLKKIFSNVYINAKDETIFDFDFEFIKDEKNDVFSPANALYSVIKKLKISFFAISVDTPFVDKDIVEKLIHESKNGNLTTIAKTADKLHPLCAIYTDEILIPLENMLTNDNHKLQFLIKQIPHKIVTFEDEDRFFNINNKEDYKKAKTLYV